MKFGWRRKKITGFNPQSDDKERIPTTKPKRKGNKVNPKRKTYPNGLF